MLNAVRFNQIPSNAGIGLEMKVIAAVVVGGASVAGGTGSVTGTVLGVVLLAAIGPALTYLGVSAYWERAVQGGIILVAIAADGLRHPLFKRVDRPARAVGRRTRESRAGRGVACSRGDGDGSRTANGRCSLVLAAEIAFFSAFAPNFFTVGNFFEITRFSAELGLLAVALTPVIVAGGIDLSVGAMMGLAAVSFGAAYHTWHLALPLAAACRASGRPRRRCAQCAARSRGSGFRR